MTVDELRRDARRRGILVALLAGIALLGLGALLFFLGWTYEEPAERLASRSVGTVPPIALSIGGAVVAVVGLVVMVRNLRNS